MNSRIDQYFNTYPRHCLYVLMLTICLALHIPATVLGIVIYYVVIKKYRISAVTFITLSILFLAEFIYFNFHPFNANNLVHFLKDIFYCNWHLMNLVLIGKYQLGLNFLIEKLLSTTLYFPFLIASSLRLIGLIKNPAHVDALKDLQNGMLTNSKEELSDKTLQNLLKRLPENNDNGAVLGVSVYSGSPVIIPDKFVNQVVLVLGTTGAGKTVTLNRFNVHAVYQGYPLIIIDGKPDADNIKLLREFAEKNNRKFYGFNCENYFHYDAMANGGHTELKDKIISLKDEWSSDYYRSIAEDYLQTTFEVLLQNSDPLTLKKVVECLSYDDLIILARATKDKELKKRVAGLENYNREDISGLQAHLNILINSELGKYFAPSSNRFSLNQVINEGAVVYFALPALRFPSFSKVLGKLVINDIKVVIDRMDSKGKKIFTVFDEFSVFAGEQVLNLVNMGRGKGVHAVFGTQGLADLEAISNTFERQLLNCANTIICHRLNDKESAESVANWIGTQDAFTLTAPVNPKELDGGLGSVRVNKEFIVHPDEIKRGLKTGDAFYVSKVDEFNIDKVQIKFSQGWHKNQ